RDAASSGGRGDTALPCGSRRPARDSAPRWPGSYVVVGHGRRFLPALVPFTPAQESRAHAEHDRKRFGPARPDRTRAHDGALADRHTGHDDRVDADVGPRADARRPDFEVRLNDRHVVRLADVLRPKQPGAGTPTDILLDDDVARVEVALRPD